MNEKKVEYENMIEIAYNDCLHNLKHLKIVDNDAYYEEKFSNAKLKVDAEKLKNLLKHHLEGFKSFEKFAKEKELDGRCYLEVYFNGEHVFAPLYYSNKNLDEESERCVDNFVVMILRDFLSFCKNCKITPGDVLYDIKQEIIKLKPGTKFSMSKIFSKYAKLFWGLDDAYDAYKTVLEDLKHKISPLDKFGDKFIRKELDPLDFDFFKTPSQEVNAHRQAILSDLNSLKNNNNEVVKN